jgi:uncharacterized protein (DUF2336 family)
MGLDRGVTFGFCVRRLKVSFSDFRHSGGRGGSSKQDRLLRAAISAFCSLTRPTRREIAQIEDLAMPLLDTVSAETRRFVAAALSECEYAPADLVRRLIREPVDIAAPLLIRSHVLTDVDLVSLIAKQGLPYARAIAKRPGLSRKVAALVETLASSDKKKPLDEIVPDEDGPAAQFIPANHLAAETGKVRAAPGTAAESVRAKLREMMRARDSGVRYENSKGDVFDEEAGARHYEKLKATALTGTRAFFQTTLADALNIDFAKARSLTESQSYAYLMVALRALGLVETQAFLIVAALFPSSFGHPEAIRLFLERYMLLHRDAAIEQVGYGKIDMLSEKIGADRKREPHSTGENDESGYVTPENRRVSRL